MPIVGFNIKSINASVEEKSKGENVDINSSPSIDAIKRRDLNVPGVKDVLSVDFTFTTKYEPKVGEIIIKGEVLYQTDDSKKVLTMWKEKRLEPKVAAELLNAIFKKCLTRAVSISDELRLPPPLTFPIVKTENPGKEATGS